MFLTYLPTVVAYVSTLIILVWPLQWDVQAPSGTG